MANPTTQSVETVTTTADKAKLATAALLVVGAVVAFYMLGQQDLWLRVVALLALMVAAAATFFTSEPGKQLIAYGQDSIREVKKVVWPTRKEALHAGRQGHRALDDGAGALGGINDLECRLVNQLVVERLQPDTDLLLLHDVIRPYSMILATTPAPTVRPPSRIAKRRPSSIAIGLISLTVMLTLSPGITISLSLGSSTAPVTSVVRK